MLSFQKLGCHGAPGGEELTVDDLSERLKRRCSPELLKALSHCEQQIGEHSWTEPALLLWAFLEADPELVADIDRERLLDFALRLCHCPGRYSHAGIWELLTFGEDDDRVLDPADVLPWIWGSAEVNYYYWAQGQFSPHASENCPLPHGWRYPGAAVAAWVDQTEIAVIHQLLEGLGQPRYQVDFRELRARGLRRLEQRGDITGPLRLTPAAAQNLVRLIPFCMERNVEPSALHLAYLASSHPDEWMREVYSPEELEAIQARLERDLYGCLPSHLQIGGMQVGPQPDAFLQSPPDIEFQFGEEQDIIHLKGPQLTSDGTPLLGPDSRFEEAESLVGWDRVGTWIPLPAERWLRVQFDQSILKHVELACVRPA